MADVTALDLRGGSDPLDSHARLEKKRSLVMRCAMPFFLLTPHFSLPTYFYNRLIR